MATVHVPVGQSIQTTLNALTGGDTLTLAAGGTYSEHFTLPNKAGIVSQITIKSNAAPGDLPAAGVRINPTYIPFLPTIQSPDTVPTVEAARGSHHYKFQYVHLAPKLNGFGNMMSLGGDHGTGATRADACADFTFDQCVLRGHVTAGQLRGAHVGCTRFVFTNNYCDRFGTQGQQSNILAFQNGDGEIDIHNNYFSGSTQCLMFGGSGVVRTVTQVVSATNSSATLASVTDSFVGQRMAYLAEGGTRRRWPKLLTINTTTKFVTFEPQDVAPDIPGDARWGFSEKGIRISRNHFAHDPNIVQNGVLQPTTGVSRTLIAGNFGPGSAVYAVQAAAPGYTGQEARGRVSADTAALAIAQDQGAQVTWTAVTNATYYYVYRKMGGVITRFTVTGSTTYNDVGTGGTVVASVPNATTQVGWIGVEFKNGIDVHMHSNVIEWCYKGSFGGESVLIKCANQEGTAAFLETTNILIENNVFRHQFGCGTISGSEGVAFTMANQPRPIENLTLRNNLWYDSASTNLGANEGTLARYAFTITNGAKNVQFLHCTLQHEGQGGFFVDKNERGSLAGLVIRDCMLRGNAYFVSSSNGFGGAGLSFASDGAYTFNNNAVSNPSQTISKVTTGTGNQYVDLAAWLAEFVNGTGSNVSDYALDVGSLFENDASDGTDIGCDIPAIETAITGVVTGTAGPTTPPPTIVTTLLPSAEPGVFYERTLASSGGAAPLSWKITSGAVPPGVALVGYGTTVAETAGIVGMWRLNETSGTVARNHLLGGTNGTYANAPTLGTTGTFSDGDRGVTLNGTDEHIMVGNVATYRPSAAVSMEAVVTPSTLSGTQNIGGVGGSSVGYCLRTVGTEARFIVNGVTASFAGLSTGTRYHLVGTYDGANVRLYVNGVSSSPAALTGAINYASDVDFVLGQRHGLASAQWFNGIYWEAAVYTTALSGATVLAHYNAISAASGNILRGVPVLDGTYTFTVQVTDSTAQTAQRDLQQVIATPVSVPVITSTGVPDATLGVSYSAQLEGTSGTLPYDWTIVGGTLAPGLNLNIDTGVISGIPTAAGAYTFTIGLKDSLLVDATPLSVTMSVIDPNPVNPEPDRPISWNGMEFKGFLRSTPPTISADKVKTGDMLVEVKTGQKPRILLSTRTGSNLAWDVASTSEARAREIAREEQAPILARVAYLPTWTAASGTPSIGNGTLEGVYSLVGKRIEGRIRLVAGSSTTFGTSGDWTFTLPLAFDTDGTGSVFGLDNSAPARYISGIEFPTLSTIKIPVSGGATYWGVTTPVTWAVNDKIVIAFAGWIP